MRAPCLARFFVLCQVYSSSRHLKNAPFAASLADLRPATLCRPRDPQQGEPPRVRALCPPSTRREERAPALLVALWLGQCVNVRKGVPLKFYAKVLLFCDICKYISKKICSIGEFCVAPFVSLQNTFQYSEFSLYFKYPFPRHTHFCPI